MGEILSRTAHAKCRQHTNHVMSASITQAFKKARQNGENVTSFWGIAFVASDMGWL